MTEDEKYRKFIQARRSCISGQFSEYVDGEGRCIAAHVRRARSSGTGYKAEFSCVPLTKEEHDCQHRHGEKACLQKFKPGWGGTVEGAKTWFDEQARYYYALWKGKEMQY